MVSLFRSQTRYKVLNYTCTIKLKTHSLISNVSNTHDTHKYSQNNLVALFNTHCISMT